MGTILVVDDEQYICDELADIIAAPGRQIIFAKDGDEALEKLEAESVDLVLTDLNMPGMDGFELIKKALQLWPGLPLVTITAHGSTEMAVKALRAGAYDFITKPFTIDEICNIVDHTLQAKSMFNEINYLRGRLEQRYSLGNIIGQCPPMQKVFDTISHVAPAPCNILVTGESGTGKELVAQAIHQNSPRGKNKFLPINCGSIPEGLLESELFGHVKGSFTGAVSEKQGLVQEANGGTLFLDEIGDMPLALQIKLLRLIQARQVQKVGSTKLESLDIRIIAATNQNLAERIQQKLFRKDLYYRINVVEIKLPPLRQRSSDIGLLACSFLKHYSSLLKKEITEFDPQVLRLFQRYPWPGNVRELENATERAVTLCRKTVITIDDISTEITDYVDLNTAKSDFLSDRLACFERQCVASALEACDHDLAATAANLSISLATLYRKLKKYNFPVASRIIDIPAGPRPRRTSDISRLK